MAEFLGIPVEGKHSGLMLIVYPQSSKAKVFEEQEPLPGESRWQLVEGCTYAYEFVDEKEDCRCQFAKENEIVRFHPNRTHHASEGTLTTGIYVGHLTLQVVNIDTQESVGRVSLEIQSTKSEYRKDYRLMLDEIANDLTNYLCRMDNYFVAHRLVKTRIFGDHTVHAYVTLSKSGSYRLFFSTIDPMALHMSIAWQENKGLRNTSSKHMAIYPLKLYKLRWGIETNYYEQKMFWELGSYKVRTKTAIEHLLNLTNSGHALMKILPYEDERLNTYRDKSPQELRHALSQQIHKEVFFATLVSKAQSSINSSTLLKALQALAWGDEQAA